MKIAVIGATGTAGSRTAAKLRQKGFDLVEVSRSAGVDLVTGTGLRQALEGVDVAIDASNPIPKDGGLGLHEALTAATGNVVDACVEQRVARLVFLSIIGIEDPVFDGFPYYVAKRAQEALIAGSPLRSTIVKTSQWHEFATNPAAVTFGDDEVLVQDWLIQPVAANTVADVLIETALDGTPPAQKLITGPERIRLPELTARLLARRGDPRPVRSVPASLAELAEGVLLAPDQAVVREPDVDTWLAGM